MLVRLFLLQVSDMTLLEKTRAKRPGYEVYIKATNAFNPWFPSEKG